MNESPSLHPILACDFGRILPLMTAQANLKRRRQADQEPSPKVDSQPQLKKQKHSHPSHPPPAFWDNLSKIPLTRRALRELDRRNSEEPPISRSRFYTRADRPVTRRFAAETREAAEGAAQHGGPDLSDLRGVSRRQALSSSLY